MSIARNSFKRPAALFAAAAVLVSAAAPALLFSQKTEAAQVQSRSITMSSASASATGVKYTVAFTVGTTGLIQGIAVDFCGGNASDTPLIGDSNCTIPTGMSLTGVAVTSPVTGLSPTTGWSATVVNSSHTVAVTNSSGASVTAGTIVNFELTGITNPSTTATFYARILTYIAPGGATGYQSNTPGSYVDYGGIALSTSNPVTITAKVMETLTFCVSGATITTCATATSPNVNIGKTVGSNKILDTALVYTASAYTQTSTNALHGAVVRMKTISSSTCAGLSSDNGATCPIPALTGGSSVPAAITAGTAAFGMCVTPGSANTVAVTPYNNTGCTLYGMDSTNAMSTYGSQIFTTNSLPVNAEADTLTYAATASNVTPAGIYSTTQSLIATGTF